MRLLLVMLLGCGAAGRAVDDGPADLSETCHLSCSGFSAAGDCYCQTLCHGPVEIFTCSSQNATCLCQGGNRSNHTVPGDCSSLEAAYAVYHQCFP
jgi:hypothetical protein